MLEEVLHQLATLVFEDTAVDRALGMQGREVSGASKKGLVIRKQGGSVRKVVKQ